MIALAFLCLGGVSFSYALWHYRSALWAMVRTLKRHKRSVPTPLPAEEIPVRQPQGIRHMYTAVQQWRVKRYLQAHTSLAVDVLRQDTQLAATAVRSLFEMEARGQAPSRETFSYPSISFGGGMRPLQRTLPKISPAALRRFGESPPGRRALNALENPIMDLPWQIGLRKPLGSKAHDKTPDATLDQQARIEAATDMLTQPNNEMSWREFLEPVLEDILTFGGGPVEAQRNTSDKRPLFLWPVDAQSVRINCAWQPGRDTFRYSQARGYLYSSLGTTDDVYLDDDEMVYMKLNPRTNTPFGLGYLEVAFDAINAFLGGFSYADRRAANNTPLFGIFLGENVTVDQVRTWQSYWENEIEGYGKVPILGGGRQPSVFNMQGSGDDTLMLKWQEFTIRLTAMSFGLSPMRLGLERDVNRSTAQAGQSDDWATISPVASIIKDTMTHWVLWRQLGWRDLEFFWNIKVADELKQAEIFLDQWQTDSITVDEIRQAYERPPLEDGLGNHTKSAYESLFKAPPSSESPGEDKPTVTPFDHEARSDSLTSQERHFLREALRGKRIERYALQAVAT